MGASNLVEAHVYRALPDVVRVDAIVHRIRTAVSLGLLHPGDKLPPELEMAESFGVAAATLRDALATLREEGVVETRRGRSGGTFVLSAPLTGDDVLTERLQAISIAELRDFGDEHSAVATASVRLAADRASEAELDRLEHLVERLAAADGPLACARADCRFRIEVAVAAQSRRLTLAEMRLQDESAEMVWAPLATPYDRDSVVREHTSLVEALRARDSTLAEGIVRSSVRRTVYHLIDTKLTLSYADDDDGAV